MTFRTRLNVTGAGIINYYSVEVPRAERGCSQNKNQPTAPLYIVCSYIGRLSFPSILPNRNFRLSGRTSVWYLSSSQDVARGGSLTRMIPLVRTCGWLICICPAFHPEGCVYLIIHSSAWPRSYAPSLPAEQTGRSLDGFVWALRVVLTRCQRRRRSGDFIKGPSQKYLEANEVKYFSLGGGGYAISWSIFHFFKRKLASCLCLPW